jgi:hypothetical protein
MAVVSMVAPYTDQGHLIPRLQMVLAMVCALISLLQASDIEPMAREIILVVCHGDNKSNSRLSPTNLVVF